MITNGQDDSLSSSDVASFLCESGVNALEPKDTDDQGTDYVLHPGFTSCWVEVNSVSVWIRRAGDRLVVELCRTGDEDCSTIDTAEAAF